MTVSRVTYNGLRVSTGTSIIDPAKTQQVYLETVDSSVLSGWPLKESHKQNISGSALEKHPDPLHR